MFDDMKPLNWGGVVVIAGFGLLVLLVWAEMGLPSGTQAAILQIGPFSLDLNGLKVLFDSVNGMLPAFVKKVQGDPNYNFYVYSFLLGIAFIVAGVGLHLLGREDDEEEKTVLPVKK